LSIVTGKVLLSVGVTRIDTGLVVGSGVTVAGTGLDDVSAMFE
jgi:hypothetical protein